VTSSAGRAGASAYAALVEWENVGRLAALASGLADRIAVAESSAGALARYRAALDRLIAADQEPAAAMAAGVRFVDAARARVEPSTWWEALVTAVVWVPLIDVLAGAGEPEADGSAAAGPDGLGGLDGLGGIGGSSGVGGSGGVDGSGLAGGSDGSGGPGLDSDDLAQRAGWAVWRVREAIEADPLLGARLVLWGRRLGGEAIALAADFAALDAAADGPRDAAPGGVSGGAGGGVSGGAAGGASGGVSGGAGGRAAAFAELADRVAKAHAAALVPLFGQQEQRQETQRAVGRS
jgi:hypothetical protein